MSESMNQNQIQKTFILIEEEMKKSYLDYSMSMITARALPDVRDGLKPVHRRILYGMDDLSLAHNRPHKKCARVVGDVMGKYHPHGDSAIYDSLVRMAQNWSLRYPMVDGQGNFGSIDGDSAAAMRYTECRMTRMAEEMMSDIEKDVVEFGPNFSEDTLEPRVLPAKIPFLLVNGTTGIAVGMATNMAPHNLREVVRGIKAVIENPEIDVEDLLQYIPGPDFPTGGFIYGRAGIHEAYRTGRGKVLMRARAEVEEVGDREQIIITEIPYMVNKTTLIEKIASLVRTKQVEGINLIRDESDRTGMRVVIGIKRDAFGDIVLNQLYKYTQLQSTFGINNLALVNGRPFQLNLKELIEHFVNHRHDVVTRRTQFDLKKAEERAHIVEGLMIAADNTDEVIKLIRASDDEPSAQNALAERFTLSMEQSKAITSMRLGRLTKMNRMELENEYRDLQECIVDLRDILARRERRMAIINHELDEISDLYGDARRTDIVDAIGEVGIEDMIADEDMVITMTHEGYIKRTAATTYRAQGRGGRGIKGMESKETDFVETMFVASAHSTILFFTNFGRCYSIKVYQLPEAGRNSKGRPVVNMIEFQEGEAIASFLPVREFSENRSVVQVTRHGVVNKQPLLHYDRVRRNGLNSMRLDEGDSLVTAVLCEDNDYLVLGTQRGRAVRFMAEKARSLGRNTRGVRGIRLVENDFVIGMIAVKGDEKILTVTENGYGKRTKLEEYRVTNRGGKGIINIRESERNGKVVSVMIPADDDDIMIITKDGIIIRMMVDKINVIGRNTQGVRLINLGKKDAVIDVTSCDGEKDDEIMYDDDGNPIESTIVRAELPEQDPADLVEIANATDDGDDDESESDD